MTRILVIGIGNEYARDDAAGLRVARVLKAQAPGGVEIQEQSGEGTALLESWKGADAVIIIDAANSGRPPGTLHRFDASREALPAESFRASTHLVGLREAFELARALNRLPPEVVVYAIEGGEFSAGEGLSPELERAIPAAVAAVIGEIGRISESLSE
ncbi:MAG TPA: hydrogenase maturation protease [Terriglobia bacterium]|nr:hydrogenase maturation protease [Terriglobia bacterium]